jgi:hypothetical protein
MPKTQGEEDKKHGDKLESLIERTGGSAREREESGEDDPAALQDDEDEDMEDLDSDSDDDEQD